jgi:transmembrane sensor
MDKNIHNEQDKAEFSDMDTREKILWRTGQYGSSPSMTKDQAFEKLMRRIESGESSAAEVPLIRPVFGRARLAVAASFIAGALILFFTFYSPKEVVVSARGSHSECILPDGTTVALNADSKITFSKRNFTGKRDVSMEGEAFFNVEKGSRFRITTGNAEITILGTSFNVFSRKDQFRVSCFTGKILVNAGSQSVVLNPGETAGLENNSLVARTDPKFESAAAWRTGELFFENIELNKVLEELERQFNVNFDIPEIKGKFFTGTVTNRKLEDALDIVCLPMGLNYEIGKNSKIIISTKAE